MPEQRRPVKNAAVTGGFFLFATCRLFNVQSVWGILRRA